MRGAAHHQSVTLTVAIFTKSASGGHVYIYIYTLAAAVNCPWTTEFSSSFFYTRNSKL